VREFLKRGSTMAVSRTGVGTVPQQDLNNSGLQSLYSNLKGRLT
jgi:hypothetical protein